MTKYQLTLESARMYNEDRIQICVVAATEREAVDYAHALYPALSIKVLKIRRAPKAIARIHMVVRCYGCGWHGKRSRGTSCACYDEWAMGCHCCAGGHCPRCGAVVVSEERIAWAQQAYLELKEYEKQQEKLHAE